MNERVIQTLKDLRQYALSKPGVDVVITYHEEDSYLMRFANSAISLNTNEHLIRLQFEAYRERQKAGYEMITDLGKLDEMKKGIDIAAEMVVHAQPLSYQPTVPTFSETFIDESACDEALVSLTNAERLDYFNQAVKGMETEQIRLSGIFASGATTLATINTRSEHLLYFCLSDAQVSIVLAHELDKWEVTAEQSAQKKAELNPARLHQELAFLLDKYQNCPALQLPLGNYDIVFGPAAIAEMARFMNWVGFNGGLMKRGFSFLSEAEVGQRVFSEKFTMVDDPDRLDTFPFRRDLMGMPRAAYPLFEQGVFKGFIWHQDDADEFGAQPTGHTVMHKSLVLQGGEQPVATLEELASMPRENDILYIPFLHYMNLVNPSKGVFTGSSRFGALLLKKDGSIQVPYNVRLTQGLRDVFGDQVAWLSREMVAYNTSASYGARNPTAVIVPAFMRVNGLEISHANPSF